METNRGKNIATNALSLPVNMYAGIPYETVHLCRDIDASFLVVICPVENAPLCLEHLSVLTETSCFLIDLVSTYKISIVQTPVVLMQGIDKKRSLFITRDTFLSQL